MFWHFFFISHKSNVKTFLKWILNQCPTAHVNISPHIIIRGLFSIDYWSILLKNKLDKTYKYNIYGRQKGILTKKKKKRLNHAFGRQLHLGSV